MTRSPRTPTIAIEAGGSKTLCALIDHDRRIRERVRVTTTDPHHTLAPIHDAIDRWCRTEQPPSAIGIAAFGPLGLDPTASDYGHVLSTPKPGWTGFDWRGHFAERHRLAIALDTDVNAAALAECQWGAGHGCNSLVYVTVGTGIGGGVVIDGRTLHGLMHAELGHVRPRRHPDDHDFPGICPFHGDCLEGLASGPALAARSGTPAETLPDDHPIWTLQSDYLGQLAAHIVLSLSPQRIVLGGGALRPHHMPTLRARLRHWLGGYLPQLDSPETLDRFLVSPGLGHDSGLLGAHLLARTAADQTAD